MKLAIACTSARPPEFKQRRDAVIHTWAQEAIAHPDIDFYFVLGDSGIRLPRRDGWYLNVPCGDGYWDLSEKTRELCKYALTEPGWDRLFKCDDDCYVNVPRLMEMARNSSHHLIGMNDVGHYHGGAGYLMTRTAAMVIATDLDRRIGNGWKKLEDQDGWKCLQARGIKFQHSDLLHAWDNKPVLPSNNQITFHYVKPANMRVTWDRLKWAKVSGDQSIPKELHFIWWKTGDNPHFANIQKWSDLHPDWNVYVWDELEFKKHNWVLGPLISRCMNDAHRSMLWRWEIINRFGGVYVDCDVEPVKNIEPLLGGVSGFVGAEDANNFCQAIFGAVAGEPFLQHVLDGLQEKFSDTDKDLPQTCGSHFLTPLVLDKGVHFRTFGPEVFYPLHWDGKLTMTPAAYAIHRWAGSWRKK
jgi:hypothetical protein